jgi:hypothetical protein
MAKDLRLGKKRKRSAGADGGDDPEDEWFAPTDDPEDEDGKRSKQPKRQRIDVLNDTPSKAALSTQNHQRKEPDRILAGKVIGKRMFCQVRWVDYPTASDTWEDAVDIETTAAYQVIHTHYPSSSDLVVVGPRPDVQQRWMAP